MMPFSKRYEEDERKKSEKKLTVTIDNQEICETDLSKNEPLLLLMS
jgi:hypothetical protein